MKISSVSKKVLASALSAAMVVAFAPTVAFAGVAGDPSTEKWTEADYIAAGAIAKKTWIDTEIHAEYYFSVDQLDEALGIAAASKTVPANTVFTNGKLAGDDRVWYTANNYQTPATTSSNEQTVYTPAVNASGTIKLLKDVKTVEGGNEALEVFAGTGSDALTIDLSGFELAGWYDGSDNTDGKTLVTIQDGEVTFKNGKVTAAQKKGKLNKAIVATSADKLTLDGVATDEVDGALTAKGTVATADVNGLVTAEKAAVVTTGQIKGADVKEGASVAATKTATADSTAATAVDGDVAVAKNGSLTATATSASGVATGIAGSVEANNEGAVVTVNAKANGDTGNAYGICDDDLSVTSDAGNVASWTVDYKPSVAVKTLNATVDSNGGSAYGVLASASHENSSEVVGWFGDLTIGGGKVVANGKDSKSTYALVAAEADITAGSYEGELVLGNEGIKGGSFTANPTDFVNTDNYDVAKADGVYTVTQFKGFENGITTKITVPTGASAKADLETYLKDALTEMAKGNSVEGLTFAEGVTAADIVAQAKKGKQNDSGTDTRVTIALTIKNYVEKNATDTQKAGKAAIEEAAKADLSKFTDVDDFYTVSCQIYYTKKGETEKTVLANVNTLGKKTSGLHTEDNLVDFEFDTYCDDLTAWGYVNGTASKIAYKDTDNDGKPNPGDDTIQFGTIPSVIALSALDEEALKNAAQKGEEAAVEKATQGIDVAQKSKTVKLAKGKTKTQKAVSFKLGASAETAVTTAKKSGSSRITVKGQKVTLKKGTKKGTYTAKVSLKAAGSDEYLAAAKTITVKFVVKK